MDNVILSHNRFLSLNGRKNLKQTPVLHFRYLRLNCDACNTSRLHLRFKIAGCNKKPVADGLPKFDHLSSSARR